MKELTENTAFPGRADRSRAESWSIGVEQQLAALWTLMDEPDLPWRLPALRSVLRHAAQAIRLRNDLRDRHVVRCGRGVRRSRLHGNPAFPIRRTFRSLSRQ